jgi:hypothetical protein
VRSTSSAIGRLRSAGNTSGLGAGVDWSWIGLGWKFELMSERGGGPSPARSGCCSWELRNEVRGGGGGRGGMQPLQQMQSLLQMQPLLKMHQTQTQWHQWHQWHCQWLWLWQVATASWWHVARDTRHLELSACKHGHGHLGMSTPRARARRAPAPAPPRHPASV